MPKTDESAESRMIEACEAAKREKKTEHQQDCA
jgi:hypothetical protein